MIESIFQKHETMKISPNYISDVSIFFQLGYELFNHNDQHAEVSNWFKLIYEQEDCETKRLFLEPGRESYVRSI